MSQEDHQVHQMSKSSKLVYWVLVAMMRFADGPNWRTSIPGSPDELPFHILAVPLLCIMRARRLWVVVLGSYCVRCALITCVWSGMARDHVKTYA